MATQLTPEQFVDAVETLYEQGETDILGGGVPLGAIADHLGVSSVTAHRHLEVLVERGDVRQVDGATPDPPYRARESFAPVD